MTWHSRDLHSKTLKRMAAAAVTAAVIAMAPASCVSAKRPVMPTDPVPPGASIWQAPSDLATRDLFYGPWGVERAPNPEATYTLVERKQTGVNLGMTVRDPQGREWSVKQPYPGGVDSEAPAEVAVSRLLSAIGYHQPPVYYLPEFTLKDDWGTHRETGGRFRLKPEELKDIGEWAWEDNPFVGSRPYQGLLALLMMFNSTDLKASNNTLYEYTNGNRVERWYVARDIGSALGDSHRLAPRKNNPDAFEREPFILGLSNGHVQFAYAGWYKNYVRDRIAPGDVVWATGLLSNLTDKQWHDAFRAGGYEPDVASRFVRKLREKVAEGQALRRTAAN
jgi:hypothetical protein